MANQSIGAITLSNIDDYRKAIGLALTFKMHHRGIPISVICSEKLGKILSHYFDSIVIERNDISGFAHKLYLDTYTPYKETIFLDADMIVFRSFMEIHKKWSKYPYAAQGKYTTEGVSSFGLDTEFVLNKIGKTCLTDISGAGHAYFKLPDSITLFETARNIMEDYDSYGDNKRFADEDVMNIAMTLHDIPPQTFPEFMGMPCHAKKGTLQIDVIKKQCRYYDEVIGWKEPYVMHFARRQFPFLYAKELTKLYRKESVNIGIFQLWAEAFKNKIKTDFLWYLKTNVKKAFLSKRVSLGKI